MGRIYKRTKEGNICFAQKYYLENTRKNRGQFKSYFWKKLKLHGKKYQGTIQLFSRNQIYIKPFCATKNTID